MKVSSKSIAVLVMIMVLACAALPVMAAEQTASGKEASALSGKLNVNSADAQQLTMLPGIGQKTAESIVAYRTQHGNFKTVDDLTQVKGIGDKSVEKIRQYVVFEGQSTLAEVKK